MYLKPGSSGSALGWPGRAGAEVALARDDRVRERRRAQEGLEVRRAAALGRTARPGPAWAVFRKPSLMCQPMTRFCSAWASAHTLMSG